MRQKALREQKEFARREKEKANQRQKELIEHQQRLEEEEQRKADELAAKKVRGIREDRSVYRLIGLLDTAGRDQAGIAAQDQMAGEVRGVVVDNTVELSSSELSSSKI